MKVLFCTDGSDISFSALHNFSRWQREAEIDVICVVDWSFMPDSFAIDSSEFEISCSNIASRVLERAQNEILNLGLSFGQKIQYCGETVFGILEQVNKGQYDLILMGSNGKKGLQRWLGSVSRDIVNNVEISTYISKNRNQCEKVLFAADGSANSYFAASEAIKYLELTDKEIYISIVLENPNLLFLEGTLDVHWLMEIENEQNKYATRIIFELQEKLRQYGFNADKFVILKGNPAEKITEFAQKENIDLIITGTNPRKKKFLESSVSKRVLEIAPSDVVIFR